MRPRATIAAAEIGPTDAAPRCLGAIPNIFEAVRKLVQRLGKPEDLVMCYEAGPTGYVLYRLLAALGVKCIVEAPSGSRGFRHMEAPS